MRSVVLCLALSVPVVAQGESTGDGWPGWRGPMGTGVAPTGDPPLEWSEAKNIRWKVAIPGLGHSSPIVHGDRIYLMTAIDTGEEGESTALEEVAVAEPVGLPHAPGVGRSAGR